MASPCQNESAEIEKLDLVDGAEPGHIRMRLDFCCAAHSPIAHFEADMHEDAARAFARAIMARLSS
jgi:hypothetical protein